MGKINFSVQEYDNGFLYQGERTQVSVDDREGVFVQKICPSPVDVLTEIYALLDVPKGTNINPVYYR